jgi:hypothetical protein
MIRFNARIRVDNIEEKAKNAIKAGQFALDNEVIKDSNFYCPEDTGILQGSALLSSHIGKGKIVWNTPYARRLYYNPQYNFSKDKNPNAGGLWFETAKAAHKREWLEIVRRVISQRLRGD